MLFQKPTQRGSVSPVSYTHLIDKALGGSPAHVGGQGLHGVQHRGHGLEAELQRVHSVKDLSLIHILSGQYAEVYDD